MSKQPHWHHQATCDNIIIELGVWSRQSALGRTIQAPGIIYAEDEAVAPDIVWIRRDRLHTVLADDGKLYASPDLVVEVLSPGTTQRECDQHEKLLLYSRHGVVEYWVADWRVRRVEIYRRPHTDLELVQTLWSGDTLISPLLPGFACQIDRLFEV